MVRTARCSLLANIGRVRLLSGAPFSPYVVYTNNIPPTGHPSLRRRKEQEGSQCHMTCAAGYVLSRRLQRSVRSWLWLTEWEQVLLASVVCQLTAVAV